MKQNILILLLTIGSVSKAADFSGDLIATGNVLYNYGNPTLNAIGTTSLNGVSTSLSTFPKLFTLSSSLDIASSTTTGSTNIDITSLGFSSAPLVFLTVTNDPNTGFINLSTSGITTTNITVNARVGSAPVGAKTINFSVLAIGY